MRDELLWAQLLAVAVAIGIGLLLRPGRSSREKGPFRLMPNRGPPAGFQEDLKDFRLVGSLDGFESEVRFTGTGDGAITLNLRVHGAPEGLVLGVPGLSSQRCPWLGDEVTMTDARQVLSWLDGPTRARLPDLLARGWQIRNGAFTLISRVPSTDDSWLGDAQPVVTLLQHWKQRHDSPEVRLRELVLRDEDPQIRKAALRHMAPGARRALPALSGLLGIEQARLLEDVDRLQVLRQGATPEELTAIGEALTALQADLSAEAGHFSLAPEEPELGALSLARRSRRPSEASSRE